MEIISSKLTPSEFVEAIFSKNAKNLVGDLTDKSGTKYTFDQTHAEECIQDNNPIIELEDFNVSRYDKDKLDTLLKLQEIEVDDEFFIELGGKPIQYGSPGERCSAMLPIVTLTSCVPLIIDQPEDNLDNRLVSKALFKILSRLKETRQIILATHNPNILVSGDAEQVLTLKSIGELEDYGCIDKPSIIENVIGLMEGGEKAFERRERKYKLYFHDDVS